jgi:hypothetical protein
MFSRGKIMVWMWTTGLALVAMLLELHLSRFGIGLPLLALTGFYCLYAQGWRHWACVFLPMASLYDLACGRGMPFMVLVLALLPLLALGWRSAGLPPSPWVQAIPGAVTGMIVVVGVGLLMGVADGDLVPGLLLRTVVAALAGAALLPLLIQGCDPLARQFGFAVYGQGFQEERG